MDVLRAILRSSSTDAVRQALQIPNNTGLFPLHLAAAKGRLELVLELVARHNADVNVADIASGRTALHHAVRTGSRPIVELLLEFEADVNAVDFDGNTPLHTAVQYDMFEITKLLVDFGAECVQANKYFQTPLDLAVHYGSVNANNAILMAPSVRVPCRNLFAVASSIFPVVHTPASQQQQQTSSPVKTRSTPSTTTTTTTTVTSAAPQKLSIASSTPVTLTSTTYSTSTGKLASGSSSPPQRASETDWQLLSNEDVKSSEGEMEWHMHKNKKFTQTIKYVLVFFGSISLVLKGLFK